MALSPVLSFPFIPLFLTPLTLPKRRASGSDNCNTQIPNRPLIHTQILTSCVFCVPWLVALPLAPVKQTHINEGRCRIKESLFLHGHTHTPVVCVPAAGSSPELLFYPPWLQDGKNHRKLRGRGNNCSVLFPL